MLTNTDLPKVMQYGGITKFLELVRSESNARIEAGIGLRNRVSQPTGEGGHSLAVAAGGGIAAFNGLHTRGNKSFEQEMNFLVEIGIFDGDADLMTERDEILEIVLAERTPVLLVDGLEHPQKTAMSRDGHTDHTARDESTDLIHIAEETGIVLNIVDDNRLSGSSDVSRDTLPVTETSLTDNLALLTVGHIEIQFAAGFIHQKERAGFGIHEDSGRLNGTLANSCVVETRVQQGADFLDLSEGVVCHVAGVLPLGAGPQIGVPSAPSSTFLTLRNRA